MEGIKTAYKTILTISFVILIQSCGLLGIHFKVHNPKKPGKTPKFSRESILLGEMTPLRSCYDVNYYDLALTINPKEKQLNGKVEIYATAVKSFDSLQLDLHANFRINRLYDVNSNREINYYRKERAVIIEYNQEKGNTFTLAVEYEGEPSKAKKPPWKGGFVWEKDKNKNPWVGVACESEGASLWWPLKDHTADEPDSMRMHYTVPKELVAIGNGQAEGVDSLKYNNTYHWFVSYPINTYNVSVYVGDFVEIEDSYDGINNEVLNLSYYVLKGNEEKASKHFKQVNGILKVYEKLFGEYPWYRDGFKLIESPYSGMEHQTAIAYGSGYKNDLYGVDYIILHEVAHEWWGNSITAEDLGDVWLQEGFATYAEALYFESVDGKDTYFSHLDFNKIFIKNKYPVVGVKDRRWFHFRKGSDVYMKGSWILHTLRSQLEDDSLFFSIIKNFYLEFKYQIVKSQDFIELVNKRTEKDYTWFFDQYLYNNFAPSLVYECSDNGTLYFRWDKVNDNFDKLKVKIKTYKGIIEIIPSNKTQYVKIPSDDSGNWMISFNRNSLFELKESKHLIKDYLKHR